MIKGQGTVWEKRRKNISADTWHSLGITYETILKGFPPFDEARRKPLEYDKLDQYHTVFHYRRRPRLGDNRLLKVIEKWQELMV